MVQILGKVKPGSTVELYWDTYDWADGLPITMAGLAVGDIKIYKDGSMTERASTSGYTLIDTDGVDLDTITGHHGISIDLADNTTADFFQAGSRYRVLISVTADAQTAGVTLAVFTIGYESSILDTTIATLESQTSFTLTSGPAEANALVGCPVIVHDAASAVQVAIGVISAYSATTKTVTLAADPGVFTMAVKDNISVFMPTLGAKLASNGLDAITATEPSGKPTTFPGWVMWLVQCFRAGTLTSTTKTVMTEAGATVTTQAVSDVSGTETLGAPS